MSYEPEKPPPWWLEAFVLTRAMFGVLMWPLLALVGVIVIITGLFIAVSVHWGLGLLGLALIAAAIFAFARWEKSRYPPLE
jgi:hypothetical protein